MTEPPREYWMPKPKPEPLDQQAVHEAVFSATRSTSKMIAEEWVPVLTNQISDVRVRLSAVEGLMALVALFTLITATATTAIAVKFWFFL